MVGAHPDDAELHFGGLAALYSRQGHQVTLLSMTDGSAGHQKIPRRALAARRRREARSAAKVLGAESVIMPFPDCELEPCLKVRKTFIRTTRLIMPDIIFTHKLMDYHPDHRATVQIVFDSAYLLGVPHVVPSVKPSKLPVICQSNRELDAQGTVIVVPIDKVWRQKIQAVHQHASQLYEWLPWIGGTIKDVPPDEAGRIAMLERLRGAMDNRIAKWARQRCRGNIMPFRYAEAFCSAPVGLTLTPERRAILFPFKHYIVQSASHSRGRQ